VTNKEILENFIQIASEAAAEYDCGFFEPTFGEDEQGVFAQTMLASKEELSTHAGDEEMPRLRVVRDIRLPGETLSVAVVVQWTDDRAPSVCSCPRDLMAVFYA